MYQAFSKFDIATFCINYYINDQFGNYLASGVYIYKVDVKDQNKEVDLMSNQELLKLIENDPEISTVLLQQSGKMIIVR